MIDFKTITKTLGGLDCYYIGQRESLGQVVHRFAVVNDQGETFHYYDAEGRRIIYDGVRWIESPSRMFNIVEPKPMKTVAFTQWVSLCKGDDGWILNYKSVPPANGDVERFDIVATQCHTFSFEVQE